MNAGKLTTHITLLAVIFAVLSATVFAQSSFAPSASSLTYPIVDTGQHRIYSDHAQLFTVPEPGQAFFGQDGQYQGNEPRYRDNHDGTVTDLVTGLTWQQHIDFDHPVTWSQAMAGAKQCHLGGHDDWRVPSIKELYSLIQYNGHAMGVGSGTPFIDTHYFDFQYGKASRGQRDIDTQFMSSSVYVGTTMHGSPTVFGVNFADGRIKGYPKDRMPNGQEVKKYVRYVRGNPNYGINHFIDNHDGTITDLATGLMWTQTDSPKAMNWQQALAWCENLTAAGHSDWRLPNIKELQSIVDYDRAPDATDPAKRGPAINPMFHLHNPQAWEWSSTTHLDGPFVGPRAAYITFGEATGYMRNRFTGQYQLLDVHGAGAQRSDPKSGDPNSSRYVHGFGPQGDVIRINNYALAVRNVNPADVQLVTPSLTPVKSTQSARGGAYSSQSHPSSSANNSASSASHTGTSSIGNSTGVIYHTTGALAGYTLFSPMSSTTTYLINSTGHVVHTWKSEYRPGLSTRLLPNGDLLRCCNIGRSNTTFRGGGAGGLIELRDWNDHLLWQYRYASDQHLQTHDAVMLPNGDVLLAAWERKTREQAIAAGRDPSNLSSYGLWPNALIEVKPLGMHGGKIVWQWHLWDHLIQDRDPQKPNYGKFADHPELLNINVVSSHRRQTNNPDFTHCNSVAYNAKLDEILMSFRGTSEIYVIDHSTTAAQAAGHTGGKRGHGGDFLFRWGNPQIYGQGTSQNRTLFGQHDASWIAPGLPGAGDILVFNNGSGRPDGFYSTVLEITPSMDESGNYTREGSSFASPNVQTVYKASTPTLFYSSHLGSAERLPNGNTLICSGVSGIIFQVTADHRFVWEYQNPFGSSQSTTSRFRRRATGAEHSLFDAFFYSANYSAFKGKSLADDAQ